MSLDFTNTKFECGGPGGTRNRSPNLVIFATGNSIQIYWKSTLSSPRTLYGFFLPVLPASDLSRSFLSNFAAKNLDAQTAKSVGVRWL